MVCHKHFEAYRTAKQDGRTWDEIDEEVRSCEDCAKARRKEHDRIQAEETIRPDRPYGQHIGLVCKTCGAVYTTKNIRPIGARSIFATTSGCDHPISDLEISDGE